MRFCYSCMQQLEDEGTEVCPYCGEPLAITCDTARFLKPGTILQNKFVIGKVLGAGGFGNTYIGWNQLLQCKVAVKEYFPRQLSSRGENGLTVSVSDTVSKQRFRSGLHQFLEEARNIASLQDVRGVVQVFNFFEENGTGYIIMEFLEGMDVKEILKRRGDKAEYEWSRRVMLTVLHTLREIHKRGILHRDIAPDNIFVTNEGVIKLIDFGAAKYAAETAGIHGEIVLKAGYAPIEQYGRKAQQGPYTDLYAAAAMFYRMLSGVKPQAANERVIQDNVLPLSDMGVEIPEQAELAIMVCLNIQPQYRLQSAEEFMEALDGADFVPVYEPEWILPEIEELPESFLGRAGNRIKKMQTWQKAMLLLGTILVISAGAGATVFFVGKNQTEGKELVRKGDIHLPSCEGRNEMDAKESLKSVGVECQITYCYQPDCAKNQVTAMEPAAGSMANKGDVVSLTVESAENVSIPDYTGKKQEDIKSDLKERLGQKYSDKMFSYNYTEDSTQKGKCYSQTVVDEAKISEMDHFKIQISWGSKESYEVTMPDLAGKTPAQAKKAIKDAGFETKLEEKTPVYDAGSKAGEIIYQSVKRGQKMNKNRADRQNYSVPEKVVVTVSKGPKPTPTPRPVSTPAPKATKRPAPAPKPKAESEEKNPFSDSSKKDNKKDKSQQYWNFD